MNGPLVTGSRRQAKARPPPHQESNDVAGGTAAIFTPVRRPAGDTGAKARLIRLAARWASAGGVVASPRDDRARRTPPLPIRRGSELRQGRMRPHADHPFMGSAARLSVLPGRAA